MQILNYFESYETNTVIWVVTITAAWVVWRDQKSIQFAAGSCTSLKKTNKQKQKQKNKTKKQKQKHPF